MEKSQGRSHSGVTLTGLCLLASSVCFLTPGRLSRGGITHSGWALPYLSIKEALHLAGVFTGQPNGGCSSVDVPSSQVILVPINLPKLTSIACVCRYGISVDTCSGVHKFMCVHVCACFCVCMEVEAGSHCRVSYSVTSCLLRGSGERMR